MSLFRKEVSEHRQMGLHGEVVLRQPLSVRVMVGVLALMMTAIAAWVAFASYARIETAPGILVTEAPSAKVIAPAVGVVTELRVREGSVVRKGERILVVSLDRRRSSGRSVAADGLASIGARRHIGEGQIALSGQRAAGERSRLLEIISTTSDQASSLQEQIALQQEVVASNRAMFDQIVKVVDRGFVSKVELERRRQTLIGSEQALAGLRQQLLERRSQVKSAEAQLANLSIDAARDVSDIRASLQTLSQQEAQIEGDQAYVLIAPVAGRVTAVQTAIGRTTAPDKPLMVIVPSDSPLRAEIYAPSRAIGFVHTGQETRLLFDAFPYQRFGSFGGKVQSISRIVIDPRETDVPIRLEGPVYRVTVALDQQAIDAFGEKIALQPGMTLQANIVLERQTFLDWLLKPLHAVMRRTA